MKTLERLAIATPFVVTGICIMSLGRDIHAKSVGDAAFDVFVILLMLFHGWTNMRRLEHS